jgi:hypothetical protein
MRAGRTRRQRSREGGGPAAVGWPEHLVAAGLVGLLVFTPLAYGPGLA